MSTNISKLKKPTFSDWFLNDQHDHESDHLGEELEWNLTKDVDFSLEDIPWDDLEIPKDLIDRLKKGPRRLKEKDLTQRIPYGIGVFDGIMEAYSKYLKEEYAQNRIVGAEYTQAYIAFGQAALHGAVSFLTSQEQLEWQGIAAQLAAIRAAVDIAIAKAQLAAMRMNAHQARVNYALTKMKLSTEDAGYEHTRVSTDLVREQIRTQEQETEQVRGQTSDTKTDGSTITGIQEKQKNLTVAQTGLVKEQIRTQEQETEAVRGQTSNETTKGVKISGLQGKQKQVYTQQIYSFQHSDQNDFCKQIADYQSIVKTADEGAEPPESFTNSQTDDAFNKYKTNVFNDKATE